MNARDLFTNKSHIELQCITVAHGIVNTLNKINAIETLDPDTNLQIIRLRLLHLFAEKNAAIENAKKFQTDVKTDVSNIKSYFKNEKTWKSIVEVLNEVCARAVSDAAGSRPLTSISEMLQTGYKNHFPLSKKFEAGAWELILQNQPDQISSILANISGARIYKIPTSEQIARVKKPTEPTEDTDEILMRTLMTDMAVHLITLPYTTMITQLIAEQVDTQPSNLMAKK
jgi:hypothetical protein